MINYKKHIISIIKYYSTVNGNIEFDTERMGSIYNELYVCEKCNFKGWNLDLSDIDNGILTCEEYIIKTIIE